MLRSTGLYAAVAILRIPYQLPGRLAPLFCEVSEGRDYVGQGRIFGYCGIGPGLRGGLINVFPGAQDSHGYLRATLPELGDQFGPFSIREGQVEHRHVERLAASDQSSPFLQRAGQGNLRTPTCPRMSSRACAKAEWSSTIITRSVATPPALQSVRAQP